MIISVSGKIGVGKDTVGRIIQYLIYMKDFDSLNERQTFKHLLKEGYIEGYGDVYWLGQQGWEIRKYADKLKDITCILLGCTREQLEDREFKEKELGEEWCNYYHWDRVLEEPEWILTSKAFYDKHSVKYPERFRKEFLTPRKVLQLLGTDCIRDIIHPNAWVNSLMNGYVPNVEIVHKLAGENGITEDYEPHEDDLVDVYPNWIITDTRFPNELKAVKVKGGITIRVNRELRSCHCGMSLKEHTQLDNHLYTPVDYQTEHSSETALDNSTFDYTVDNNGTIEELIEKIKIILTKENLL